MIPSGLMPLHHRRLLAYDDFSEADNTNIATKSLDIGGSWVFQRNINSGSGTVISGKAQVAAGSAAVAFYVTTELSLRNVIVSGTLTTNNSTTAAGVALMALSDRVIYSANTAGTFVYGDIIQGAADRLRIVQVLNGVSTVLATNTTVSPAANTTYNCSLVVNDSIVTFITPLGTLTATLNGTFNNTSCGFYVGRVGTEQCSTVDNFRVEAL